MLGVDIRNSTSAVPYTETRLGYSLGAVIGLAGVVLMLVGYKGTCESVAAAATKPCPTGEP
jgi:hypothetical protein